MTAVLWFAGWVLLIVAVCLFLSIGKRSDEAQAKAHHPSRLKDIDSIPDYEFWQGVDDDGEWSP